MPESQEVWDKKKVTLGVVGLLFLLALAGYALNAYVLGAQISVSMPKNPGEVAGARNSSQFNIALPKEEIEKKIESIVKDVQNINVLEIASSSPQIQKVLNDIKALESYPRNQAKEMCKKICEGI